jgi:DNA-binding response OmpR family regulator
MPRSQASDVYVVHAMLRSLLPYVTLLDLLVGVGRALPELASVREALIALDNDAQAADPARRPASIAALRARYREIRRLAGDMPEPDDKALRELFADFARRTGARPGVRLRVDVEARRVEIPDRPAIDLSRRHVLWRVLSCLLEARRTSPGRAVERDELREAGWPGEKILAEAARSRIYVAISQLRKLGLGDAIVQRDEGYLIAPEVEA